MEVTIGAKCYNGTRSKSLSETFVENIEDIPQIIKEQNVMDKVKRASKRLGDPKVRSIVGYTIPAMLLASSLKPMGAFAETLEPQVMPAMSDGIKQNILHAFDPLIDLIVTLAYPIAGVMIAGGCLFIMCGNREKGMGMLQNAAIGYILVQLSPMMLKLLVGIGGSI